MGIKEAASGLKHSRRNCAACMRRKGPGVKGPFSCGAETGEQKPEVKEEFLVGQ